VQLAKANAFEEAERVTTREEKFSASLQQLGKMLSMTPPKRIESFDISNISGTDIVASMVVFEDGKPKKSEYKRFKIEGLNDQDDYASMRQVLTRRFTRLKDGDKGFDDSPDLLLIDGGITHAKVALDVLQELNLDLPLYGMVKDDRHRTRALVTPDGGQIAIDSVQAVFALIGNIQEETHRFAITYHRSLRSKRLRYSELDSIPGIGPKRKQELLKTFKSLTAIGEASLQELERLLPKDAALAVYEHFRRKGETL
jgi:excinuclease ABC subunit C